MLLNEVSQAQMSSNTYLTLRSLSRSQSPSERENDKFDPPSSHAHNLIQRSTAAYNHGGVECLADEGSYDAGAGLCLGRVCCWGR